MSASFDQVFVDLFNHKLSQIKETDATILWQLANTNQKLVDYGLKSFIDVNSLKLNYNPSDKDKLTNVTLFFKFLVFVYFTDETIFSAANGAQPPKNGAIDTVNNLFTKYNLKYAVRFAGPYHIEYLFNGQRLTF
jgi:hypothetical protein